MEIQKSLKGEELNCENFEDYLEDDISFVQFFNSFLTLPVFPQRILYNIITGIFEEFENTLADSADVEKQEICDLRKGIKTPIDKKRTRIGYYVKFLSRADGLDWVKRHRLELFLKSEIYADFKLSKLLSEAQSSFLLKLATSNIEKEKSFSDVGNKQRFVDGIDISKLPLWQRNQILVNAGFEPDHDGDSGNEDAVDDASSLRSSEYFFRSDENENSVFERSKMPPNFLYKVKEEDREDITNKSRSSSSSDSKSETNKLDDQLHDPKKSITKERLSEVFLEEDTTTRRPSVSFPNWNANENDDDDDKEGRIESWLRRMSRTKSTAEAREEVIAHGISHMEVQCDDTFITEVLASANQNNDKHRVSEPVQEGMIDFLKKADLWPINLSYKQGINAFKEFLFETQGERNLLLWLEIERSKYSDAEECKRTLVHIKDHFIRSGAPFEITFEIWKKWGIKSSADISMKKLIEISPHILAPLLNYWCQRFTIHQHRRKNQFIEDAIKTAYALKKQENVPQRPLTGFKHYNLYRGDKSSDAASDSGISSEGSSDLQDRGITRSKIRCKSAYPRILSTKLPVNTNVGYDQLQLISSIQDEGFGFKAPPTKSYKNDASTLDDKMNVRLYMTPVPPLKCSASTLSSDDVNVLQQYEGLPQVSRYVVNEDHLDSLVDMLLHENFTGHYFLKHLQALGNRHWLNCYFFWKAVRDYSEHFYSQSFKPFSVQRKANAIYISFISDDGEQNIQCPKDLYQHVTKKLNPPFEELFDNVEHFALNELIKPWKSLVEKESLSFSQMKIHDQMKYIEVNKSTKYNYDMDKRADLDDKDEKAWMDGHIDKEDGEKISPEEMSSPLPSSKDPFNFDLLIRNKSELEFFQMFLESKHREGANDLTAWTDMELFRKLPHTIKEDRDHKAMEIRKKWLSPKYFFGKDSPATNSALKKLLDMCGKSATSLPERPSTPIISEAQKYIRARVERRWLILFKETTEYLKRRKRKSSVSEIVEDLIMKKKIQRSEHAWKVLNSRWNSSSRDISALRMALNDHTACEHFRRFISVKSDLMCNNLNFWLEVQEYKDLCHSHVHASIIQEKLKAVIDVFIKSQIPPELQIDIPIEMAERLHDKVAGKNPYHGPYLFREAQATVFRIMFSHWKDFQTYRNELPENLQLSQSLSELEKQHHDEIMRKKLEHERKRLTKLVVDKKKKKNSSTKDKDRSKSSQDLFSYLSKTVDSTHDVEPTSFLYSQHMAENQLNVVESIMHERGYLTQDIIASEMYDSSKKRNSRNSTRRNSIADSILDRRCSSKSTSENVSRQISRASSVHSIPKLFPSKGALRNPKNQKSLDASLLSHNSKNEIDSRPLSRDQSSRSNNRKLIKSGKQSQSVSPTNQDINKQIVSIEAKDLKKALSKACTFPHSIPVIRIDGSERTTPDSLPSINAGNEQKQPIRKIRIPRNAGTATLIARMKREEKKKTILEKESNDIKPEVIVF